MLRLPYVPFATGNVHRIAGADVSFPCTTYARRSVGDRLVDSYESDRLSDRNAAKRLSIRLVTL